MAQLEHLDLTAAQLPVDKAYTFAAGSFIFRARKNSEFPSYTIEVFSSDGRTFLFSNRLTYGQNFMDYLLGPFTDQIIPLSVNLLQGKPGSDVIDDVSFGSQTFLGTAIK